MKHSTVKHSNVESSSRSPVAVPRKRKRQSAGSTETENGFSFLFLLLSSFHIVVTRLSMMIFAYAERLTLYYLDILYTSLKCELKQGAITHPTPMHLEQLSPISALAAGD